MAMGCARWFIDLLSDRTPATVEAWICAHPDVEGVARVRNGGYRWPLHGL